LKGSWKNLGQYFKDVGVALRGELYGFLKAVPWIGKAVGPGGTS
jgi:hypothetical protein